MAECVVARCVQERRFLKRELQKWGKNVLYLVGLERVAQEIMGVDRWTKLSQPQLELETNELVDWNPDDKCYFCNNWKNSPLDSINGESSLIEDYLSDQEHGTFSRSISPTSINSDQPLDLSIGNRTRSLSPNGLINGELNGSSVAALLKVPHIPDKSGKLKRPVRIESAVCKRSYTEDELQAALHDIQSGKLGTRRAAVIYGIPRSTLRNKVYKLALIGEKASLQDSSKVNKVETTNKNNSKSQTLLLNEDHNFETKNTDKSTLASESLRRLLRNRISENLENHHLQQTLYDTSNSSMFASLESNPALAPILSHVLANVHQLALMSLQGSVQLDDDLKDESGNLNLPLLPDLIRKLTEKRLEEECDRLRSPPASHAASQPSSKLDSSETAAVILKIPSYKPVKTVHNSDANSALVSSSQLSNNSASSSVNHEASSNGSKIYGATLKEIIAKNITQRVNKNKQTISSALSGTSVATSNGSSAGVKKARAAEAGNSSAAGPSGSGHSLRSTRSSSSTSSSVRADSNKDSKHEKRDKPEKRSRPKRGRYRNYDRDNLVEAVRAVQRGEMSVHRAGSFYGVPHSTLEYKVKERHLLRQRKHRSSLAKMGKSAHANSGGKTASSTSSSCSNSSCSTSSTVSSMKTAAKNNNTKATATAVGEKRGKGKELQVGGENVTTSGENLSAANDDNRWSNSPLFALDFSRLNSSNFFASQMMRKLQEDALTQGSRNTASAASDTLSNRDALLLGVLLRNGLQMTESNGTSK